MNLFLKRVIAYILDFFVVSAFMWIFSYLAYFGINYYNMFSIYNYLIWILPIVTILYVTILEKNIGATVGKRLMFILGKISGNTRILDKISRTVVLNENDSGFDVRRSRNSYY